MESLLYPYLCGENVKFIKEESMNKLISCMLIFVTAVIVIFRIVTNSADVILHWNAVGHVTDYGSRYLLLLFPLITIALYVLWEWYIKHPAKVNMGGVSITKKNKKYVISYLLQLRIIVLVMIGYLAICASGYLPFYALLVILGIVIVLFLFVRTKKLCKS